MTDDKEINLSLVDFTISLEDFAIDEKGDIRIAGRKIARELKSAIEQAKRYPAGSKIKGKMVIPIET